ncbi:hypothetical protein [Pseudomonas auratipiscis]|uniref:Uncharacterized protein n=1 Tax=Pseudomonas auratipiscis TaxID=3115853 RepID=A0AB35WQN1_9PSED|nr:MULTISPECIES: hypothetical protein [unclassified Pseudomonas]MEE1867011.1 hypothetical protein [Pseudomonas sp. 120P]MEE1957838.1 hypothetical protein [Pseudomonas sp. 119P]
MFVSDPQEEVITLIGKVDPSYKSWPRVDTSETFFHVHTKQRGESRLTFGVVLLATPRALLDFLECCQRDEQIRIEQIALSTPPHANQTKHWRTEALIKLEVSFDDNGVPNSIIYHTADDAYYEDRVFGKDKGQDLRKLQTIYKARSTRRTSPGKSNTLLGA